jgi:hypothetical protein
MLGRIPVEMRCQYGDRETAREHRSRFIHKSLAQELQIAARAACATSARPNEHTMNARSPAVAAASFIQAMGAASRLETQFMFLFCSVKNKK